MTRRFLTNMLAVVALCPGLATSAAAQSSDLSQAVLSLPSRSTFESRLYEQARLFGGLIDATITNLNGNPDDFDGDDLITFRIQPRTGTAPSGVGFSEFFTGTHADFEQWARRNAGQLLRVLFPGGLSYGAAGRDMAGFYAQQLMLTTVLNAEETQTRRRWGVGGLVDSEWLRRDVRAPGDSAWGIQGIYALGPSLSVQARFGRQQEALQTSATSAAIDYHPFIERGTTTRIRIGGSARAGFLYSSSRSASLIQEDPLRFGSLDFAGGAWTSARRRFAQVTVAGGGMLQATKTYMPPGDEGTFRAAFSDALNELGIAYDVTLGATARYDATKRVSLIGRVAETHALDSSTDRPAIHLALGGVMFALAPGASVDVGYKITSFADTLAQSVFFQGNFGW